jgi:fusion protein PurCD
VWTAYQRGERSFCGNFLPDGLSKNQKFDRPIITPTTKSDDHDQAISEREIIERHLMTQEQWLYVADKSLQLFARGTQIAQDHGLILVDTKYEFGYDQEGRIYLIDEIHTTDSSRYWLKASYEERLTGNQEPESIDKEFLRLWFVEQCDPYHDKVLPEAPQELVVEVSRRYIQLYQTITGQNFQGEAGDVSERIRKHLKDYGCH